MKLTDRIKSIRAGIKLASKRGWQSIDDLDKMMDAQVYGRPTASGIRITTDTAANFSAWFNGCQQISQTVASLPLIVYKKQGNVKKHYSTLPLYKMFRKRVNIRTDAFAWKEKTQYHLLSWGNAYSFIERDAAARPVALWLINPESVRKIIVMEDGSLMYEIQKDNGEVKPYRQDEILHIRGFGFDGIRGYSILTLARETIGLGLMQEEFLARFYGQGTNVGGTLEHPTTLSKPAQERLIESFNKAYSGIGNAHKVILLEEGMKFNKTIMPLVDAQFLEQRVYGVQDIARWLNMPPHKLKDLSKATYSNIEQEQATYYQDTIRPWLERQEAAMDDQLLPENDFSSYCEYDINAILRADILTRYRTYDIARRNGVMNANEWRDAENMNPIEEDHGKIYWAPTNMTDAAKIGENIDKNPDKSKINDETQNKDGKDDEGAGDDESIDKIDKSE